MNNTKTINLNHSNHIALIDKLRSKKLHFLIKPYKELVYKISGNTQKKIFKTFSKELSSTMLKEILINYLNKYDIHYEEIQSKKYPDKTNTQRAKRFRENQRNINRKKISFYIDDDLYLKINKLKDLRSGDFASADNYESILTILYNKYVQYNFK